MLKCNCIVVFDKKKENVLFCLRRKDPYKGLYNFVGGKVEAEESDDQAAYRELFEETGIASRDIRLHHFMDLTYYHQDFLLELYVGQLREDMELVPEKNPLYWLPLTEDFADPKKYAGEQNIAHIINVALKYPLEKDMEPKLSNGCSVGVDGCKGGWIAAVIDNGDLTINKYANIQEIVDANVFDSFLIDMVVGLPDSPSDLRPDAAARKILSAKASSVFPIPARNAVYEYTAERQREENIKALGKSLAAQSIAIIPKMRELDTFLTENKQYIDRIEESHPEVCFARLNGSVVLSKKSEFTGQEERIAILSKYLDGLSYMDIKEKAKQFRCNMDDIIDAICLAVTANLRLQGKTEGLLKNPMRDKMGLLMQMEIPKVE